MRVLITYRTGFVIWRSFETRKFDAIWRPVLTCNFDVLGTLMLPSLATALYFRYKTRLCYRWHTQACGVYQKGVHAFLRDASRVDIKRDYDTDGAPYGRLNAIHEPCQQVRLCSRDLNNIGSVYTAAACTVSCVRAMKLSKIPLSAHVRYVVKFRCFMAISENFI